ncbi:RidA family protein [Siminovitchia fortis]|uniref:RidA family protein n=1 Tax=Siminovitchia fortis TaxID=254758 RepID=UPI0011A3F7F7|nr:RidA family protein [Siminovitchia fortis]
MDIEERILKKGIELPPTTEPMANYISVSRTGNLLYTSGASCFKEGVPVYQGRLGEELTVEEGYEASRLTALNIISNLKKECGSLNRIKKIVKMLAFVNSADSFTQQPEVINGASDLFMEIFGEKGKHARSAIGTNVLPFHIPVEIELIVEINE